MDAIRRYRSFRLVAVALLLSVVSATIAPAVSAGTGATSRLYAEWLRERLPGDPARAVEAVLLELSGSSSASLDAFVVEVVRTLVREEGLSWTSQALLGRPAESQADITAGLLEGLQSLGPGSLPDGFFSARQDASRVVVQRTDLSASVRSDERVFDDGLAPVLRDAASIVESMPEPGRGDVQPLGP